MDELTLIQEKLDKVNEWTLDQMRRVKNKCEKFLWEEEAANKGGETIRQMKCRQKRKKIIELFPKFWSTAFLGVASLRKLLNETDKKIIMEHLKTVDVEDRLDVKSGLSKKFSFSHNGIADISGTEIKWKNKRPKHDVVEKGSGQSSTTDVRKSFLEWFSDDHLPKDQDRDEVAETIAYSLWPYAPVYYINATKTSVSMAAGIHADENGLPVSDSTTELRRRKENEKLMEVHAESVNAKEAALTNRWDLKYDLQVETEEKVLRQQKTELCRSIYEKRSEIIKGIPFFWLNAFISHSALADILNEDDHKIFRYLECVNVEEIEDPTLVHMITLNFNERNPYFENASLTKTFSHCVEGEDTNGCTIKWKDSVCNGREYPGDRNVGFFTWFSGCGYGSTGNLDEVAELIIEDLWPNAIKYYFNGNRNYKKESRIVKVCRLWAASNLHG
ncbi:hypothetical protein MKW98_006205 [Papaver atlanticum]|uniref:Uncharacterized protein n=1 Tax=Papaver atlanticum TaxID=357466 RepID=A0AAD4TH20_9MAGN|nr:hypothetical protein MKW98_006205 [Papaver atlanticum]